MVDENGPLSQLDSQLNFASLEKQEGAFLV